MKDTTPSTIEPSTGTTEAQTGQSIDVVQSTENKQDSTEVVKFEPSDSMVKWVDTAIQLVSDSPSEVAEGCGMDRGNWYKWMKIPGFEEWFYAEYKKKRQRWLPTLDRIGMQQAKRDFEYWKAMNRKAGESLEESKNTTTISGDKVIAILGNMKAE